MRPMLETAFATLRNNNEAGGQGIPRTAIPFDVAGFERATIALRLRTGTERPFCPELLS